MASLCSVLAICIIFMVIIQLSSSNADDTRGKQIKNKRIKPVAMLRKHQKSGKRFHILAPKRRNIKDGIKHGDSYQPFGRPKWSKKQVKKESPTRKLRSHKIKKPKGQRRRPKLVNKIQKQKGKKSFSKNKNARGVQKNKKWFLKTGIKKMGRRRGLKVGIKGRKVLGTKIKKFKNEKIVNEVLVNGKNDVPIKPTLPLKSTYASQINQVPKAYAQEKDYKTTSTIPTPTYSLMHKDEPEKPKVTVTSRPEASLVSYQNKLEIIESLKKTDASKTSLPQMTTESYKTAKTTEINNEITKKPLLDIILGPERANVGREHFRKNFIEPHNKLGKKSTPKAAIATSTAGTTQRKYPDDFFGAPPGTQSEVYFWMHCALYKNKTCYQDAAPSKCYESDWAGNCINGTAYLYYIDKKTYEKVTIPPLNNIRTPEPGDFHLRWENNRGITRRCVVHEKGDGLIKDTCVDFEDVLRDIPRLSQKIIAVHYGSYSGNGNKREDRLLALDAIRDVLNGYGTCERIAAKLPFLRQYFQKYAEPCYQKG